MKRSPQLWASASSDFAIPLYAYGNRYSYRQAGGLRALYWPDGTPCWEATAYLIQLRKRGRATSTVNTYASELSHFLRFAARRLRFQQITDDALYAFADQLRKKNVRSQLSRSGSHINRILSRSIALLCWLQDKVPGPQLVGVQGEGANVTVEIRAGGRRVRGGVFHPSFVEKSEAVVVRPMADSVLDGLVDACNDAAVKSFTVARYIQMINLLADSGIRREELVFIRVEDFEKARTSLRLNVRTSKRKGNPIRQIPIPEHTIQSVALFVDVQRTLLMNRLLKKGGRDDGWLFCTQTGSQMKATTVTQFFALLKRTAGIEERATPHMLRHRWITLQLVRLIKELGAASPLSVDLIATALSRLGSLSGHVNVESMWRYVDLTFDQLYAELAHGRGDVVKKGREAVKQLREALQKYLPGGSLDACLDAINLALAAQSGEARPSESGHSFRRPVTGTAKRRKT